MLPNSWVSLPHPIPTSDGIGQIDSNLSRSRNGLSSQESLVNSIHLLVCWVLSLHPLPEPGPEASGHLGAPLLLPEAQA